MNQYELHIRDAHTCARYGRFHAQNLSFATPNFMPVATRAALKGVSLENVPLAQVVLVNTYHLWLRPGPQVIKDMGGIRRFMATDLPVLSDSGGYQVFSLKHLRKITEEGVTFNNHLDGSRMFLSPELAVDIQDDLGVNIAMVLDECPPHDADYQYHEQSLDRTLRWARRCLERKEARGSSMALFGITQGGMNRDLRTRAAEELSKLPFCGYAVGGLSVGEGTELMHEVLGYHPQTLPADKIRYLMGVGTPHDIVVAVKNGIDLFDCVMPTRCGRFGRAFIGKNEYINIRNNRYKLDQQPVDSDCACSVCRRYSRGYLHHLFKVDEMLGMMLLSQHNLHHYLQLMADIRHHIKEGTFLEFSNEFTQNPRE